MEVTNYSETKHRLNILELLDPLGLKPEYLTFDLEKLKTELELQTNAIIQIQHKDYFDIYNMNTTGITKSDEVSLMKFHLNKKESEIKRLADNLRRKEDELHLREITLDKIEKRLSKSPMMRPRSEDIMSASPSAYRPFSYKEETKVEVEPVVVEKEIDNVYINGDLSEDEAISKALAESEMIANSTIDEPFSNPSVKRTIIHKPISSGITAESLREQGLSPYHMLENRPEEATDEILDHVYDLLVKRDFPTIKELLSNKDFPLRALSWIKSLKYNDTTFKQMLLSKPVYIQKCLRPYE